MNFKLDKAVHLCFESSLPVALVTIYDATGKAVYARRAKTNGHFYKFCANLKAGAYRISSNTSDNFKVKILGSIPAWKLDLPPHQWKRATAITKVIVTNDPRRLSPAETNVREGIMYLNPKFFQLPYYVQEFIKAHEEGHLFYMSEEYCDLYAVDKIMRAGGSLSPCLLALEMGLRRTPNNISRTENFFSKIVGHGK
jgi:hypothetical protein